MLAGGWRSVLVMVKGFEPKMAIMGSSNCLPYYVLTMIAPTPFPVDVLRLPGTFPDCP